jgi:hypothetical protein
MTEQQAIDKLNALTGEDPKSEHLSAEEILKEFLNTNGASGVADAFDDASSRGRGFWYA